MKKIILYLLVVIATFLMANYFTSCSVVNKSKSLTHTSEDSTTVLKEDSTNIIHKDSSSTELKASSDSTGSKHIKKKEIVINFDTSSKAFNSEKPYRFDVAGTIISSPQPIQSATIEDNREDDSSTTNKDMDNKAVKFTNLDSTRVIHSDSTKVLKTSKTVDKEKQVKSFPWQLSLIGLLVLLVAGYIIYRKYF